MRIEDRTNDDGSHSYLVRIKIPGMKVPVKAFRGPSADHKTPKAARAAAESWGAERERELREQRRRGAVANNVATITVSQLIDEYLKDDRTLAMRSLADRQRSLEWWRQELGTLRCYDQLTPMVIRRARDKLKTGARANATVNRYIAALRKAWNFGRATQVIPLDRPWPPETQLVEPRGRVRYLSKAEQAALLAAAEPYPAIRAAIIFSIAVGCRRGEMLGLKWTDVTFGEQDARIHIRESKNGDERVVYVPPVGAAVLKALRAAPVVSAAGAVFLDGHGRPMTEHVVENQFYRHILPKSGIKNFHWHDLRHCTASFLAQHGATLLEIAHVLGHRSMKSTQRYAHLQEGLPVTGHAALNEKLKDALITG